MPISCPRCLRCCRAPSPLPPTGGGSGRYGISSDSATRARGASSSRPSPSSSLSARTSRTSACPSATSTSSSAALSSSSGGSSAPARRVLWTAIVGHCSALLGPAQPCSALLGPAQPCSALLGPARPCSALLEPSPAGLDRPPARPPIASPTHRHTQVWGEDIILDMPELIDHSQAVALTYVETYTLRRNELDGCTEDYPVAHTVVAKARRKITMQRAILKYLCEVVCGRQVCTCSRRARRRRRREVSRVAHPLAPSFTPSITLVRRCAASRRARRRAASPRSLTL